MLNVSQGTDYFEMNSSSHIVMIGISEGFGMFFFPHLQSELVSISLEVSARKYQFGFHGTVAFEVLYGYSFMEPC